VYPETNIYTNTIFMCGFKSSNVHIVIDVDGRWSCLDELQN